MRALLSDLDSVTLEQSGVTSAFDVIFAREELEHGHACRGCIGCWVTSPGACVMRDGLEQLGRLLGTADELVVVSRNTYGGFSPLVKRGLDRTLPYLHPCFRIVDGELHHRMRYDGSLRSGGTGTRLRERIVLYGPSTPSEREGFLATAAASQLNQDTDIRGVWFCEDTLDIPACLTESEMPFRAGRRGAGDVLKASPLELEEGARQHSRQPHCPTRIGLIHGSPRGAQSATHALLEDFSDALAAYDRLGGASKAPRAMVRFRSLPSGELALAEDGGGRGTAGRPMVAEATTEPAAAELSRCDAIVIAYPLYMDALPSNLLATLDQLCATKAIAQCTRIYAISNLGFYEPEQIMTSFAVLRNWCEATGATWSGGLAVGAGGMLPKVADTPRMGALRRATSEAMDRLIVAVRSGLSVSESAKFADERRRAAELAELNVIATRCALPRIAYRAVVELGWHAGCKKAGTDINAAPAFSLNSR